MWGGVGERDTRTNTEREESGWEEEEERAEEEGSQTKCGMTKCELRTTGKWAVFIEHASFSAVPSLCGVLQRRLQGQWPGEGRSCPDEAESDSLKHQRSFHRSMEGPGPRSSFLCGPGLEGTAHREPGAEGTHSHFQGTH